MDSTNQNKIKSFNLREHLNGVYFVFQSIRNEPILFEVKALKSEVVVSKAIGKDRE